MYTSHVTLTPMKIKCCNATASKDASFSKAFCDTDPYHESHAFSNVYKHVHVIKVFEKIWEKQDGTNAATLTLCVSKATRFHKWP